MRDAGGAVLDQARAPGGPLPAASAGGETLRNWLGYPFATTDPSSLSPLLEKLNIVTLDPRHGPD